MSMTEINVKLAISSVGLQPFLIALLLLLFNFDIVILISVIISYEVGCFSMRQTAQNSSKLLLKGILQKNNRMESNIEYKMINQ